MEEYREQFAVGSRLTSSRPLAPRSGAGPGGRDGRLGHEETVALGPEIHQAPRAEGWKVTAGRRSWEGSVAVSATGPSTTTKLRRAGALASGALITRSRR